MALVAVTQSTFMQRLHQRPGVTICPRAHLIGPAIEDNKLLLAVRACYQSWPHGDSGSGHEEGQHNGSGGGL